MAPSGPHPRCALRDPRRGDPSGPRPGAGRNDRQSLQAQVRRAGLDDSVRFEDRFVAPRELKSWLAASDVFVTPYPNLEQIVSGTLAYALGAGRAIVSTPYRYAAEMLGDRGGGLLVPPSSPSALGEAIASILADRPTRHASKRARWQPGDDMRWPRVGESYRELLPKPGARHGSPVTLHGAGRGPCLSRHRSARRSAATSTACDSAGWSASTRRGASRILPMASALTTSLARSRSTCCMAGGSGGPRSTPACTRR